jgi:hypothetical protein
MGTRGCEQRKGLDSQKKGIPETEMKKQNRKQQEKRD